MAAIALAHHAAPDNARVVTSPPSSAALALISPLAALQKEHDDLFNHILSFMFLEDISSLVMPCARAFKLACDKHPAWAACAAMLDSLNSMDEWWHCHHCGNRRPLMLRRSEGWGKWFCKCGKELGPSRMAEIEWLHAHDPRVWATFSEKTPAAEHTLATEHTLNDCGPDSILSHVIPSFKTYLFSTYQCHECPNASIFHLPVL